MKILGINDMSAHDTGAAILVDNQISAIEEERFTRIKHQPGFLREKSMSDLGIKWLFRKYNIKDYENLDYIVDSWNTNILSLFGLLGKIYIWSDYTRSGLNVSKEELKNAPEGYISKSFGDILKEVFKIYKARKKFINNLKTKTKVRFIDHHLCHASLAYRTSSFDKSLIFIIDGSGEKEAISIFIGNGNNIKKIKSFSAKNYSVGTLYTCITRLIGLGKDNEGKTMALADYGKPIRGLKLIKFDKNKKKLVLYFENIKPYQKYRRTKIQPILQIHKNIAATLQNDINKALYDFIIYYVEKYQIKDICLCGGVALNCKFNGLLVESSKINQFYSPAGASDSGVAFGAVLEMRSINNPKKLIVNNFLLGYETTNKEILDNLKTSNLRYTKLTKREEDIVKELIKGKIIGIYNGPAELGPRALGNRSIIALANRKEIKDIINKRVKHREEWRPFAMSVLEEDSKLFFNKKVSFPYMNVALICNKFAEKNVLGLVHIDKSIRFQTVNEVDSPYLYKILKELKNKIGYGAILNTSFNDQGEPIVNTPADAINTFKKTEMDLLYINQYKISKK